MPDFEFKDQRQSRIHKRLKLVGSGPAAFFKQACMLMSDDNPLPSASHLVAHLLREIESAIRDVLEPQEAVDKSLQITRNSSKFEILNILNYLEIPNDNAVAQMWIKLNLHKYAHRSALEDPRPIDDEFRGIWDSFQAVLDRILDVYEAKYLDVYDILDKLVAISKPSKDDVKVLRSKVPNNTNTYDYFFGRMSTTEWLPFLIKTNFYKHPPGAVREDKGTLYYPVWPQTKHLARLAQQVGFNAQKPILDALLSIPRTDNVMIHDDILDIACSLKPDLAAKIAEKELEWIKEQEHLFFIIPVKFGKLITHLSHGGIVDSALKLTSELLQVLPPKIEDVFTRPVTRIEIAYYIEILTKNVPDLAAVAGEDVFNMLCELLDKAIRYNLRSADEMAPEDFSRTWRRRIKEDLRNVRGDLRYCLLGALRDVAENIVRKKPERIKSIIERLNREQWICFYRLSLYLLYVFRDQSAVITAEIVTGYSKFDTYSVSFEYRSLLKDFYGDMSPGEQQKIVEWIKRGPDIEEYRKRRTDGDGNPPSEDDIDSFIKYWRRDRIHPIKDMVVEELSDEYRAIVAELGEPVDAEAFEVSARKGFTTPLTIDELKAMTVEEIVEFVKEWKPGHGMDEPSSEGLGMVLSNLVQSEPDRFAEKAKLFKGLDPDYVRGVTEGLWHVVRENKSFEFSSVIELCAWVMDQPREIEVRRGFYRDIDPGWVWTRHSIADLIKAAIKRSLISVSEKEKVWPIIQKLTEDPDPSPDRDESNEKNIGNIVSTQINSVRGKALQAVLDYAHWIFREYHSKEETKEDWKGFSTIPEVEPVLSRHLDPNFEKSLAIWTLFSMNFDVLIMLDRDWLISNINRIFPEDERLSEFYRAAWGSYVVWNRIYKSKYDLLKRQYMKSVELFSECSDDGPRQHDPDCRLAEHIIEIYLFNDEGLKSPESIVKKFFDYAPGKIRGHAIYYVSEVAKNNKNLTPEQLNKLKSLWKYRLEVARTTEDQDILKNEVPSFGYMYAAGLFDAHWSIEHLKETLALSNGKIERDHEVIEHLATHCKIDPLVAIECLSHILLQYSEIWRIDYVSENAKTILQAALDKRDPNTISAARELINRVVANGYFGFSDML